jgi:hypothetical protein
MRLFVADIVDLALFEYDQYPLRLVRTNAPNLRLTLSLASQVQTVSELCRGLRAAIITDPCAELSAMFGRVGAAWKMEAHTTLSILIDGDLAIDGEMKLSLLLKSGSLVTAQAPPVL